MNEPIPAALFKSTLLQEVPRSEFLGLTGSLNPKNKQQRHSFIKMLRKSKSPASRPVDPYKKSDIAFDISSWLRFKKPPTRPVGILVCYQDSKGEFAVIVDETRVTQSSPVLLSGNIILSIHGELKYMQVRGTGIRCESGLMVDKIQVKKINSPTPQLWAAAS